MPDINSDLSKNISNFSAPAIVSTHIADRDILSSALQKSLRRAHLPCAITAANGLINVDPQYFWRRLATIAFEDFGLSDLVLTAQIVGAARNRSWRMRVGGDFAVAAYFLKKLTLTPTDRRVDDLYMLGVAAAKYDEYFAAIQGMTPNLARVALHAVQLSKTCERLVPGRGFRTVMASACDQAVIDATDTNLELANLCIAGRKVSQCLLPVLLPLLYRETINSPQLCQLECQDLTDHCNAGIPLAAIDGYTLAGRSILLAMLRNNKSLSSLLAHAKEISAPKAAATLLFCAEGGLLRNQLCDPQNKELSLIGRACWSGLPRRLVPEALSLMREQLPTINAKRFDFLEKRSTLSQSTQLKEN